MAGLKISTGGTGGSKGWWVSGNKSLILVNRDPAADPGPFRLSVPLQVVSAFAFVLGLIMMLGAVVLSLEGVWTARLSSARGIPTPVLFLIGSGLLVSPWFIRAQDAKSHRRLHTTLSLDSGGVMLRTVFGSYRVPWGALVECRAVDGKIRGRKVLRVGLTAPAGDFLRGQRTKWQTAPRIEPVMCSDEVLDAAVLEFYRLNPDERAELGTAARRANLSRAAQP